MSEPPKPRHLWYQFSLRTLLIVVTLLAVIFGGVGQQIEFVRHRRALLDRIVKQGSWYISEEGFTSAKMKVPLSGLNLYNATMKGDRVFPTVSWLRCLLGDREIERIGVPLTDPLIDEIRAAFPEAMVAGHRISEPNS